MKYSPVVIGLVVLAIALLAGGVILARSASPAANSSFTSPAPVSPAVSHTTQVPSAGGNQTAAAKRSRVADFTLPDLSGKETSLYKLVNNRPFVICFGTTRCPYCLAQMETFKSLRPKYGEQVVFIEVQVGEPPARVAAHLAEHPHPFTTLLDRTGQVFLRYGTRAVPVVLVADARGTIVGASGFLPAARITGLIDAALKGAE